MTDTPRDIAKCLAAAFDALPQRATLPDWANAWRQLAQETGLLRAMKTQKGEGGRGTGENKFPRDSKRCAASDDS